jgi:MFS family permease
LMKRDPSRIGEQPYGETVAVEHKIIEVEGYNSHQAVRSRAFALLAAIYFTQLFAQQLVMVHIVPQATDCGIEPVSAALILTFIGATSIFSRISAGNIGDRISHRRALILSFGFYAAAFVMLQFTTQLWMFYFFAVIYGIGYGSFVALQSLVVAELFGMKSLGAILGAALFVGLTGGALGTLVAGRLFDITGAYQAGFLVAMSLVIVGLVLTVVLQRTTPSFREMQSRKS